ncbi:MAG: sigma-54 dependent transcriptional regulator [Balneolales bacterium]|nr:sigma-54 dependent transcriptional regulator [Balneolales bacterium]
MDQKAFGDKFGLISTSESMGSVIKQIRQVAPTDITVLLQGESGVGKDVVARSIHGLSKRSAHNLVIVNCGAIPEGIIESELFGHEKGAFTGAHESREGYFEKADGGTIFLDEIGDTPKNVQVKLLRVLENGEFFRVGSSKVRKSNARIITATNRDLWKDVQNGTFREDLFYRLNTVTIRIPPLRERPEDIIPIFRKFVLDYSRQYDSVFQGFADEARNLLVSYRWPGNIRELRNVAEQLVVLEKSEFITTEILQKYLKGRHSLGSPDNLPIIYKQADNSNQDFSPSDDTERELVYRALVEMRNEIAELKKMLGGFMYSQYQQNPRESSRLLASGNDHEKRTQYNNLSPIDISEEESQENTIIIDGNDVPSFEEAEKFLIQKALDRYDGNRRKASEALGVSERTLYRKIDQYNLL